MPSQRHSDSFPDLKVLIVEHQADGGPGLLAERLDAASAKTTVVGPHLAQPVPEVMGDFDALVVLGGSPGPMEDEKAPWLPHVRTLIQNALDEQKPTLGICLGAQMLTMVAGGHVSEIDAGPEIGLVNLELTDAGKNDPLLSVLDDSEITQLAHPPQALQWHWLEAKALPPGSTTLLQSAACSNQAFRVGQRAWGVQFHPEALGDTAKTWSIEDSKNIAELGLDAERDLVAPVRVAETELRAVWARFFDRWIALAATATQ
jgi:GMP synthase-like glutamine amidotransferase